jgi:hypothetical protein
VTIQYQLFHNNLDSYDDSGSLAPGSQDNLLRHKTLKEPVELGSFKKSRRKRLQLKKHDQSSYPQASLNNESVFSFPISNLTPGNKKPLITPGIDDRDAQH